MDPLLIIAILSGIALVFIFVVARIAARWGFVLPLLLRCCSSF